MKSKFTPIQGQYLMFISHYTMLNRIPPTFKDFENYFGTSPATVNSTIQKLEEKGFITKEKGVARSIKLQVDKEDLPDLE